MLIGNCLNLRTGVPVTKKLRTGSHTIADVYCVGCTAYLGWKYVSQFVIELK